MGRLRWKRILRKTRKDPARMWMKPRKTLLTLLKLLKPRKLYPWRLLIPFLQSLPVPSPICRPYQVCLARLYLAAVLAGFEGRPSLGPRDWLVRGLQAGHGGPSSRDGGQQGGYDFLGCVSQGEVFYYRRYLPDLLKI